ncbi:DUF421 domain-containing protein [Aquimarina intermedia]|uniref:Uncharacterized protein DUF421 n=1 Tax=Aquimarina intermedia TaxID=350814 RepID=A0A5S5BUI4_9FLAO|nr:YetF domain-containing protein [Aquimarina intermedia]TYP69976.1 uncharacterized protein DUF421 [Aquimarina intermedia]
MEWILNSDLNVLTLLGSVLGIYLAIIGITRIAGLRTFAKMTSFDFASTIAIGSIIASVIMNTNQSLVKGLIALAAMVSFQVVFSILIRKSKTAQKIATNTPLFLAKDGEILYDNLAKSNVSKSVLIAKLREANVIQMSEVKAVVLESTGDVSVLHTTSDDSVDSILLEGVRDA